MTETPGQDVPAEAQEQIRKAVDTALAKPQQAQGFLSNVPDLSAVGGIKDKVIGVLDTVLGALNTVAQYKWLIPDQYEAPLDKLVEALNKVRGWLD
jgi:hypothetical protein